MKVKVKRINKDIDIPTFHTKGAIGFDFSAREKVTIKPGEIKFVPLNIIMAVPKGYGLFIFSRSSTPIKKGLIVANGAGIIDQDYCGEEDELKLCVWNFSKKIAVVERGERIAQGVMMKVEKPEFVEVEKMSSSSRGGFGTTGK